MLNSGSKLLQNGTSSSDRIGPVRESDDIYEARNYGSRARKTAQNYTKYNSWNGTDVVLAPETKAVDDSGICSPPLWTTSPPGSPQRRANHYRSLSPASRTQAIVRGQKELMDMVRNMPEACYELSLKDLVEHPLAQIRKETKETVSEERALTNEGLYRREGSMRMNDKRAHHRRIGGLDGGGLYLKMGFPVSLGSRKNKKKNEPLTHTSAKVSPKPAVTDGSVKGVDKEWWNKRFSASGGSESGESSGISGSRKSSGSSSSSSSSSRSRSGSRRGRGGCWGFFRIMKHKIRTP